MQDARRLVLKRETLTELSETDLTNVVGAATVGTACGGTTRITVLVSGCPSNPQVCEYQTDFC